MIGNHLCRKLFEMSLFLFKFSLVSRCFSYSRQLCFLKLSWCIGMIVFQPCIWVWVMELSQHLGLTLKAFAKYSSQNIEQGTQKTPMLWWHKQSHFSLSHWSKKNIICAICTMKNGICATTQMKDSDSGAEARFGRPSLGHSTCAE